MGIFLGFYFLLIILTVLLYKKKQNSALVRRVYILCSAICILLPALRDVSVGTDTANYVSYFLRPQFGYNLEQKIEIGFQTWNSLIRGIWKNTHFYLFCSCLLAMIPLLYFIYKNSTNKLFSLLLITVIALIEPLYFLEFGMMRQSVAIALFLMALYFFHQNSDKFSVKSILFFVLACLIHSSSILSVLIFLLVVLFKIRLKKITGIILIILSILVGGIILSYFIQFLQNLSFIELQILRYAYSDVQLYQGYQYYVMIIPTTVIGILLLYYSTEEIRNSLYFKLTIIEVIMINILIPFPIGYRIVLYLFPLFAIMIPRLFVVNRKVQLILLMIIAMYLYRAFAILAQQTAGLQEGGNIIAPYNFFF